MLLKRINLHTITKSISMMLVLTMMMPLVSWSFDKSLFEVELNIDLKLGGPGSQELARKYYIPAYLAKVSEASYHAGGKTLILIQDLHCNYEVQKNIQGILQRLTRQDNQLKLVTVEGASGIIPTLDIGLIKDTPAKRAVADYFVAQGKLTGADYFAVCDDLSIELYGAEEAKLYDDSIALIRGFSTDQHRGIILEMLDQMQLAKDKVFNPALAELDSKRIAYLDGRLTTDAYQGYLIGLAKQYHLPTRPGTLATMRNLDYYEKQAQQRYLEQALVQKLITNQDEQTLSAHQMYVEVIDRIINIAASPQDLIKYQKLHRDGYLMEINEYLKNRLGSQHFDLKEELKSITQAVGDGLAFYDLAEQRNHAIYNNTMARIKDRREQSAVMITGGFHTEAISQLAQAQGHSVITIRPNFNGEDSSSHYYDLLLNPDQQSEFESLVAQNVQLPSAIQVVNFLTSRNFKSTFAKMVDLTRRTAVSASNNTVTLVLGGKRYFMKYYKDSREDKVQVLEESNIAKVESKNIAQRLLKNRLVQALILTFTSTSAYAAETNLLANTILLSTPVLVTAFVVLSLGLIINRYGRLILSYFVQPQGIMRSALLAGLLWLTPVAGNSVSQFSKAMLIVRDMRNINYQPSLFDRWMTKLVNLVLTRLSRNLPIKPKIRRRSSLSMSNLMNTQFSHTMRSIIKSGPLALANEGLVSASMIVGGDSRELLSGISFTELSGALRTAELDIQDELDNGIPVSQDWAGDNAHVKFVEQDDVSRMLQVLVDVGLGKLAAILAADFYKEPDEGYQYDIGPIATQILDRNSVAAFERIADKFSPQVSEFITRAITNSNDKRTEKLYLPRLVVRHPLLRDKYEEFITQNLAPRQLKNFVDKQYGEGFYDSLFDEIVNPTFRGQIQQDMNDILEDTDAEESIASSMELAKRIVVHGILHEVTHALVLHLPVEKEEELFKIIQQNYIGRIDFKNWMKALKGIKEFRAKRMQQDQRLANPSEATQVMAFQAFMTEMVCDTFAIYLMQKAAQQSGSTEKHVYESVYDTELSPELANFYDWFLDFLRNFEKEDRLLIFDQKHLTASNMIAARAFTAAALVPIKMSITYNGSDSSFRALTNPFEVLNTQGVATVSSSAFIATTPAMSTEPSTNVKKIDSQQKHTPSKTRRRGNGAELSMAGSKTSSDEDLAQDLRREIADQGPVVASALILGSENMTAANGQSVKSLMAEAYAYNFTQPLSDLASDRSIDGDLPLIPPFENGSPTNGIEIVPAREQLIIDDSILPTAIPNPHIIPVGLDSTPGQVPAQGDAYTGAGFSNQTAFLSDPALQTNGFGGVNILAAAGAELAAGLAALQTNQPLTVMTTGIDQQTVTACLAGLGLATGTTTQPGTQSISPVVGVDSPATSVGEPAARLVPGGIQGAEADGIPARDASDQIQQPVTVIDLGVSENGTPATEPAMTGPTVVLHTIASNAKADYVRIRLTADGQATIAETMTAVSADELDKSEESLTVLGLIAQSELLKAGLANAEQLGRLVLINDNQLAAEQAALLTNFERIAVDGYRPMTAKEERQFPLAAMRQALEPVFASGDRTSMIMRVDLWQLEQMKRAMARHDVVMASSVDVFVPEVETGHRVNQTVLSALAAQTRMQTAAPTSPQTPTQAELKAQLQAQVQVNPFLLQRLTQYVDRLYTMLSEGAQTVAIELSAESLTEDLQSLTEAPAEDRITSMRARLSEVIGQQAVEAYTDEQVQAVIDEVTVMSTLTVVLPIEMLLQRLQRSHGQIWDFEQSLWMAGRAYQFIIPGRQAPALPQVDIAALKETNEAKARAQAQTFSLVHSVLILTFAAGLLVMRAIKTALALSRQTQTSSLTHVGRFLSHPGLRQELWQMAKVAFQNQQALDGLNLAMQKKLAAMMNVQEKDLAELKVDDLTDELSVLKTDHASFTQFINELNHHAGFRILRQLASIFGLNSTLSLQSLYPYLFVLFHSGDNMQRLNYYTVPAQYLTSRLEQLVREDVNGQPYSGISSTMKENLDRLLKIDSGQGETILARYQELSQEYLSLRENPQANQIRLAELNTMRRDYKFAVYLQRAIEQLAGANNARNREIVLRLLLKELTRMDVSEAYHEDALRLITLLDPYNQQAVQLTLESERPIFIELPRLLMDTKYRDLMLNVYPFVYDENNQQVLPFRRRITTHQTSA